MKKILKEVLSTSLYLLFVLVAAYLIVTYVGQRTQVSGSSMETTLSDNDHLLVDKLSYRFNEPERFDIIVFPFQYDRSVYYIKRIIGLPGETVEYIDMRNPKDIYIKLPSVNVRLGELDYMALNRVRNISAILPQIETMEKKIKYIDLRWEDAQYTKLEE